VDAEHRGCRPVEKGSPLLRTVRRVVVSLAAVVLLLGSAGCAVEVEAASPGTTRPGPSSQAPVAPSVPASFSFVVIGDIPYGPAQLATFPTWVGRINSEPNVELVAHLGDVEDSSSPCSDAYNSIIKKQFNRFTAPLVYTPGDNEWTDCPRGGDGASATERLAAVRETFFPIPGWTLGQSPLQVTSDARSGYPENVFVCRDGAMFLTLHVVGSDNGLRPRSGRGAPTARQVSEVAARTKADIAHLHAAFRKARSTCPGAVIVLQQADMFAPGPKGVRASGPAPYSALVGALAAEARGFTGRVYLFNGDSHKFRVERPLATDSEWLRFYHQTPAENVTQVTVDGDKAGTDYLKVTLDGTDKGGVLSWRRVPYDPAAPRPLTSPNR
jgi:hypothetical protein